MNGMWQTLSVDRNMPLNTRDFLARIVALFSCRIGVLYALCINNAETGGPGPTIAYTDRAN